MALPNDTALRRLGQGSAGAVGSANGVAAMYAAATTGIDGRDPLLSLETIATISAIHSSGPDLVRGDRAPYAVGFEAKSLLYPFLGAHAFGHTGSAGSDGFADPHSGLTYGYTRRRPHSRSTPPRTHGWPPSSTARDRHRVRGRRLIPRPPSSPPGATRSCPFAPPRQFVPAA